MQQIALFFLTVAKSMGKLSWSLESNHAFTLMCSLALFALLFQSNVYQKVHCQLWLLYK